MEKKKSKPLPPKPTPTLNGEKVKKSSKTEMLRRHLVVHTLLLRGADRAKIFQYASEKWSITERQTDNYIAKARLWMEDAMQKDMNEELQKARAMRMDLYFKAYEASDYGLCNEILKDTGKLIDIYPTEKRKHIFSGSLRTTSANPDTDALLEKTAKEPNGKAKLEKFLAKLDAAG